MIGIRGQRPKNRTSIVITSWKNQEFSDTTRDGKFYVQVSPLLRFWRYVSDVSSSSSAVPSSALGLLCTSVGLGICPRGQGRFLMGFHELANKSTDSQFQFLDRDAWRQPWFGHAF